MPRVSRRCCLYGLDKGWSPAKGGHAAVGADGGDEWGRRRECGPPVLLGQWEGLDGETVLLGGSLGLTIGGPQEGSKGDGGHGSRCGQLGWWLVKMRL